MYGILKSPRNIPLYLLLMSTLVIAMLSAGCGSSAPTTTQTTKAPASKQVLIWPIEGVSDIATLDPALSEDVYSGQAISMVFNGLVMYNDKAQIVPDLAQSYSLSSDGLTWTFHLRPGLKFSDGSALTSDDVVYSINRALDPATKSGFAASELAPIKDVSQFESGKIKTLIGDSLLAPDPQTVEIVTSVKAAYLLSSLTASVGDVLEKSFVQKYGSANFTSHLVGGGGGAGPFTISAYKSGQDIEFVPNPYFYGAKPQLTKVIFPFYKVTDTGYKAYQADQIDETVVPTADLSQAKALPNGQFRQTPSLSIEWFTMNYLVKPFDDIKIRQAFALALNKSQIAQFIWKGTVIPTNHIIPQGNIAYNPNLTAPGGVKGTAGDPTLAKQLFNEGLQEEGLTRATLPPIVFQVSSGGDQDLSNTYTTAQQMWQNTLGISVKIDDLDFNKLVTDITGTIGNGNVMALAVGWSGTPDPYDWTTMQFGKGAGVNLSNYGQNHSTDAAQQQQTQQLLAQADGEVANQQLRIQEDQQAEQQLVNDVAWLPIYQQTNVYVVKPCVVGWPSNPWGSVLEQDWPNVYISTATPCGSQSS
ncbi:MAG TPA: peptide ABC transporter substrate-binding protein [Ktedonobacteraceae bacterium]|nr:peptide ABC transporter substrate-binding protein [Ktedonobacteraceae bacterium]